MLNFEAGRFSGLEKVFGSFLEQDCELCGAASRALVCGDCEASLPRVPEPISTSAIHVDDAAAVFSYRFPVDRLIQRFKYGGDLALGRWLAGQLVERVRAADRPALIVAPPSAKARLHRRGFNPALEIAKIVARSVGAPCAISGLERARDTMPQPGLGRIARSRNLAGAMRSSLALDGMHVAIVDDVLTTGATANVAAKILKERGAARVSVWVVARTPGHV